MKVLKNGVEVHKVRMDVVRKEDRPAHASQWDFLNLFKREMRAEDYGLKGSRGKVQLKRRRIKKIKKSSRRKNR